MEQANVKWNKHCESCLILILSESFASESWANPNVTRLFNSFTFLIDISHYFIYDWSELFLFSLFYSDKEDWTVCILVGSHTNWVCYPVDNEWTNSVLFESITILVFLVVTAAQTLSSYFAFEMAKSFIQVLAYE